jgi:hypothetical protein
VETGSFDTFQETVFTFSFTLASGVPNGSVLYVMLPNEVSVISVANVQSSCKSVKGLAGDMICKIERQDDGKNMLIITNGTTRSGF